MPDNLLDMDRLPTLDELKEFFKNNDWTAAKLDDSAQRTAEEREDIAHAAKLMDEHFEQLAREKGRSSSAKYYGANNPLIALQKNTEDLVASAVTKIANDDELLDSILSQFDFADPDIDQKADSLLHNAVGTMLNVMEYDKLAAVIHENSDDKDFNKNIPNNFRYQDHIRRVEHTDAKVKVTLSPDPNAQLHEPVPGVEDEAIGNVLVEQFIQSLDEKDIKIYNMLRAGYTQKEIAEKLGFSNNGAVSKRMATMKKRFYEMIK